MIRYWPIIFLNFSILIHCRSLSSALHRTKVISILTRNRTLLTTLNYSKKKHRSHDNYKIRSGLGCVAAFAVAGITYAGGKEQKIRAEVDAIKEHSPSI